MQPLPILAAKMDQSRILSSASCNQLRLALPLRAGSGEVCVTLLFQCVQLIFGYNLVYKCLNPTCSACRVDSTPWNMSLFNVPSCAQVTAFLSDGIIFLLFLVQRKSVLTREEWTEESRSRQRNWWFCRTAWAGFSVGTPQEWPECSGMVTLSLFHRSERIRRWVNILVVQL